VETIPVAANVAADDIFRNVRRENRSSIFLIPCNTCCHSVAATRRLCATGFQPVPEHGQDGRGTCLNTTADS